MNRYRITPKAQRDLVSIAQYSRKNWGAKQKNKYIAKLKKRIEWLAANPNLGEIRSDVKSDVLSFPEGEHLIFYIIESDQIEIIGILHGRMDMSAQLN